MAEGKPQGQILRVSPGGVRQKNSEKVSGGEQVVSEQVRSCLVGREPREALRRQLLICLSMALGVSHLNSHNQSHISGAWSAA